VETRSATGATPRKAAAAASSSTKTATTTTTTPRRRAQAANQPPSTPSPSPSKWLAANPSKRWAEVFFLAYSPFWIAWALCVIVPLGLYDRLDAWGYLAVGLAAALPCFLLPLLVLPPCAADAGVPLSRRYWVKANVWVAVFSHVGNYFWTHYFFNLLGARYTFPAHLLNGVPVALYLMTHAYFCFYHALANVALRRVESALAGRSAALRKAARAAAVFALAYATAYGETLTIAHFPHYTFVDRSRMYTVGSLFYALYFWVSFPLFMRIDEHEWAGKESGSGGGGGPGGGGGGGGGDGDRWGLGAVALDALAAGMLVTILLDAWRLVVGGIVDDPASAAAAQQGLQWAAQQGGR